MGEGEPVLVMLAHLLPDPVKDTVHTVLAVAVDTVLVMDDQALGYSSPGVSLEHNVNHAPPFHHPDLQGFPYRPVDNYRPGLSPHLFPSPGPSSSRGLSIR